MKSKYIKWIWVLNKYCLKCGKKLKKTDKLYKSNICEKCKKIEIAKNPKNYGNIIKKDE